MTQWQHPWLRFLVFTLAAIVLACCLVVLWQLATCKPLSPYLVAILAALLALAGRLRGGGDDLRHFADTVGHAIDDIMIGAAETSYFVDSVEKKLELVVRTASEIADSSEQNALTTEKIAANAECRHRGGAGLQESLLAALPQLAYAGAVDNNGYFPTHNKKFSQPLTGDYEHDIVHKRTKRIFSDRTGSRCGSNTQAFLLQTYKRDTGRIMHDLSAPICVDGKHWGGFRVG